jgi:hypothetical protein
MNARDLLAFLRTQRLAVQASLAATGMPQAAVVGIAVSDRFEIVFDTVASSRKAVNLRSHPKVALVIGGLMPGDERTVQLEGLADEPAGEELERLKRVADEPAGEELERLKRVYYDVYPDGPSRLSWPGLIYVRVRPTWVRFSDYNQGPPLIVEFTSEQLGG